MMYELREYTTVVFPATTGLGENSSADMEATGAAFQADQRWRDAKAAGEADGPINASIRRRVLRPTEAP